MARHGAHGSIFTSGPQPARPRGMLCEARPRGFHPLVFSQGLSPRSGNEQKVMVSGGAAQLEGILSIPAGAGALIVFAYDRLGNFENAFSYLNILAAMCQSAGLSALLVNLLTPEDEELDKTTLFFRENIGVLHQRVIGR